MTTAAVRGSNGGSPVSLIPMTEVSTSELLAAAGDGARDAWDALVDRYARLVWSVIRGFRFDEATAGDISQTVWLRLVENLECQVDATLVSSNADVLVA